MSVYKMPRPDSIYFLDEKGLMHYEGTIVFRWSGVSHLEPPFEEPAVELEEIEPILDFIRDYFHPNSWRIKDGKVTEAK